MHISNNSISKILPYEFIGTLIKEIVIPEGVTIIDYNGFSNSNIEKITFPSTLNSIGNYAFANTPCTTVILPHVMYLLSSCFRDSNVRHIAIPPSITWIGSYCFYNITLETLILPQVSDNLYIGDFAFALLKFNNFTIPENTNRISNQAFSACVIEKIIFPGSVAYFGNWTLAGCSVNECIIKSGVTHLQEYSFAFSDIEKIEIPSSVIKIDQYAFMFSSIKEFLIPAQCNISNNVFQGCYNLEKVTIGQGCIIGTDAFIDCNSLRELFVHDSVMFLGNAFGNIRNTVAIMYYGASDSTIPDTINNIKQIASIVNVTCSYTGSTFCGISVNKLLC